MTTKVGQEWRIRIIYSNCSNVIILWMESTHPRIWGCLVYARHIQKWVTHESSQLLSRDVDNQIFIRDWVDVVPASTHLCSRTTFSSIPVSISPLV
ncbi:unnamed protein product [Somion occarium]|uniref:Uncharacterized protein n=1 Tax=Somion occarium TaxID=3059160 RepID=A0ABP1DY84_9APHY